MKKNKKNKTGKPTLFGGAAKSLKKLGQGTATRIGGLSTTQKVVGGAALVAFGLSYLAKRRGPANGPAAVTSDELAAEESLSALDGSPA